MARPKLPKRKVSVSVTIPDDIKKVARKIGEGNMSKGLEIMARKYIDSEKAQKNKDQE